MFVAVFIMWKWKNWGWVSISWGSYPIFMQIILVIVIVRKFVEVGMNVDARGISWLFQALPAWWSQFYVHWTNSLNGMIENVSLENVRIAILPTFRVAP
jgi:hypothetical protein